MTSETDNPRVYNCAYGLCRDPSNHLLLVRITGGLDKGRWTLPGGGIEWGEHPDDTVIRELAEEKEMFDEKNDIFLDLFLYNHHALWMQYYRSNK